MFIGKLLGGLLGFMVAGFFGAILGAMAGHLFDRGLNNASRFDFAGERRQLRQQFFTTAFQLMGHLAKSDGRINEAEIAQAEAIMARLELTPEHRQQAIQLFKQGAAAGFQLEPLVAKFVQVGGRRYQLPMFLLEFLITMALADGELHENERQVLFRVAELLGMPRRQFEQLLAMFLAQEQFSQRHSYQHSGATPSSTNSLSQAYQALGVTPDVSDRELKKAYRRLMSEHHPDKLIARGVPDDMVKVATEKSQQIQQAYELVKKSRE